MKKIYRDFNDRNTILPTPIIKNNLRFKTEKFFLFVPKQIKAIYHKLEVSVVGGLPNEIVSVGDVFFIEINEKDKQKKLHAIQNSCHYDIAVDTEVYPYEVYFDPEKITDFLDLGKDKIEFDIVVTGTYDQNDQPTVKLTERIQLKFIKVFPEPEISFEFEDNFTTEFEHRMETKVKLGILKIKNTSKVYYSYPLDCKINVIGDDSIPIDSFYYGEEYEVKETMPSISGSPGLRLENQRVTSSLEKKKESYNRFIVKNILPNNQVEIPVYANFDKIPNPVFETSSHKITFLTKYKFNGNESIKSTSGVFTIKQDTKTTALMSLMLQESNKEYFNRSINLQDRIQWQPEEKQTKTCFVIRLGNFAENGTDDKKGNVVIKDLSFSFSKDDLSPSDIKTKNAIDLSNLFIGNNNKPENSWLTFPDGKNSFKDFTISFRDDMIDDIPNDLVNLVCKVNFKYKIDNQVETSIVDNLPISLDSDDDCSVFEHEIRFTLEKNPGPYWLAMDFGTSAYVAAYNDIEGSEKSFELLNLQKSFEEIVRLHRGNKYFQEQVEEFGTNFISSSIMLMDGGKSFGNPQPDELIRLSPLNGDISINRIIPYIKSLIGTVELPNFNNKLDGFKYGENGNIVNFIDSPLLTTDLLLSVYEQVINNFIIPQISNKDIKEKINKLVLSYPNNFTPKHLKLIKDLIAAKFKQFKSQYLTFISESDAIASYYLDNWIKLNKGRKEEEINAFASGDEYVLVYDMGAGTLDITYFCIHTDNDLTKTVKIIGKIGNTLAGNYFDYVLADVIVDMNKDLLEDNILVPSTKDEQDAGKALKQFVKDKLKPSLYHSDADIVCDYSNPVFRPFIKNGESFTLKIDDIKNHEFVKKYIYSNSKEIFTNLFSLFSKESQGFVKIDTVIFSGRGVQLKGLKDKVLSVLENDYLAKKKPYGIELKDDTLKSAVVEGALRFATVFNQRGSSIRFINKNLMARYGILYRDRNGKYAFKELLNPTTKPSKQDPIEVHGMRIFEYDTDIYCAEDSNDLHVQRPLIIDCSATDTAQLIQTYSLDPAADKENGKTELITTISSYNVNANINKSQIAVRLQITRDNALWVSYGTTQLDAKDPLMIDILRDEQFKHSLWPYL